MRSKIEIIRMPAGVGNKITHKKIYQMFNLFNSGIEKMTNTEDVTGHGSLIFYSDDFNILNSILHEYIVGLIMNPKTKKPNNILIPEIQQLYDHYSNKKTLAIFYSMDILIDGVIYYKCFPIHTLFKTNSPDANKGKFFTTIMYEKAGLV